MKLADFKYAIPRNLIAKTPAQPRDHSKMMVVDRKAQQIEDKVFYQIADYFRRAIAWL